MIDKYPGDSITVRMDYRYRSPDARTVQLWLFMRASGSSSWVISRKVADWSLIESSEWVPIRFAFAYYAPEVDPGYYDFTLVVYDPTADRNLAEYDEANAILINPTRGIL